ncbi:MAG: PilZ domain-containing protein [Candidatus Acidiferrales bacterium]
MPISDQELFPMSQKSKPLRATNQRSVRRCALVASAEVTELRSGAVLSARISELGVGGCYVDALNPFPEGTPVVLRILRDQGVFETTAKVVYCDARFGMGLAFTETAPDQRSLLEAWIAEIVGVGLR